MLIGVSGILVNIWIFLRFFSLFWVRGRVFRYDILMLDTSSTRRIDPRHPDSPNTSYLKTSSTCSFWFYAGTIGIFWFLIFIFGTKSGRVIAIFPKYSPRSPQQHQLPKWFANIHAAITNFNNYSPTSKKHRRLLKIQIFPASADRSEGVFIVLVI